MPIPASGPGCVSAVRWRAISLLQTRALGGHAAQVPIDGLSYVRGADTPPLVHETTAQLLRRAAAAAPDAPALVDVHAGARLSYGALLRQASAVAAGLLRLGVRRGDRVGVWAGNSVRWALLQYGAALAGAALVSVNPAYTAPELAHALAATGARVLCLDAGDARRGPHAGLDAALRARAAAPALERLVLLGDGAPPDAGAAAAAGVSTLAWGDLVAAGEEAGAAGAAALAAAAAAAAPGDVQGIQFTSGTTGLPKPAALSHLNVVNNARFVAAAQRLGPADAVCVPVPLFHCFGQVMGNLAAASAGAAVVYPAPAFDAAATLAAVAAERCTSLYGVPTMFVRALEALAAARAGGGRGPDVSSLRTGIMAGAPCPEPLMRRVVAELHMRDVTVAYGMTETSPVSFQTAPADPPARRCATAGRVQPHLEAKVVAAGAAAPAAAPPLPVGAAGELLVRGYAVFGHGYWGDAAATAAAVDAASGWLRTGDLAALDARGYCSIVGRLKDTIIRGGENVSPREVEDALHAHPLVGEAHAFGVPDAELGERVAAWVVPRAGARAGEPAPEELSRFCHERLAHFKVPSAWRLVAPDEVPTTASGKPQKFRMRALEAARQEDERAARSAARHRDDGHAGDPPP